MISSEKELAELLDSWAFQRRALITERTGDIVAGTLSNIDALVMIGGLEAIGWGYWIEDGSQAVIAKSEIDGDYGPYKVTALKPAIPEGHDFIMTNAGLKDWLKRPPLHPIIEVSRLSVGFATLSVKFATRGQPGAFEPEVLSSDPRTVVRENGQVRTVSGDISHWILRPDADVDLTDPATMVWADEAATKLATSLSNEVEGQHTLILKGPPVTRYEMIDGIASALGSEGFKALQACARWAFSVPKEMETRHILLTAELSRSAPGSSDLPTLFRNSGLAALEGAKIAFEMGLHKISADTLKALADLRKAVSDEAAKLGDSTRQLASAVSGAMFGGIALIVARLTMATSNMTVAMAVVLIGVVLFVYVGGTILTGNQFVRIQRELRNQWRNRLYRFLPDDEYQKMVIDPAQRAERAFSIASWISGILAVTLLFAVLFVSGPELWKGYKDWWASAATTTPSLSGQPASANGPAATGGSTGPAPGP